MLGHWLHPLHNMPRPGPRGGFTRSWVCFCHVLLATAAAATRSFLTSYMTCAVQVHMLTLVHLRSQKSTVAHFMCNRRGCRCLVRRAASAAARSVAGAATRSVTSAVPQASPTTGEPVQQQHQVVMQLCCVAWRCPLYGNIQITEFAGCIRGAAYSYKLARLTVYSVVLHCPLCCAVSLLQRHCC